MSDRRQLQLFGEREKRPAPPSMIYGLADRLTLYLAARGDNPIPLEEDEEFWRLVRELDEGLREEEALCE